MVCGCLVVVGGAKLVVDDIGVTPAALGQDARPSSPQNPRCGRVGVEEDEGQDEDEGQAGSRPERKLERAGPQHKVVVVVVFQGNDPRRRPDNGDRDDEVGTDGEQRVLGQMSDKSALSSSSRNKLDESKGD